VSRDRCWDTPFGEPGWLYEPGGIKGRSPSAETLAQDSRATSTRNAAALGASRQSQYRTFMADQSESAAPTPSRLTGTGSVSKKEWSTEDRSAWVQLAYEAGLESVKAQREELSGIRTRALTFTAFVATGTAFLVGRGLGPGVARDGGFVTLSVIGTVCFVALAALLVVTVAPLFKFRFILEPRLLMDWLEGDQRAPSRTVALRGLVKTTLPAMLATNEKSLQVIRWLYRALLALALLTLTIWVAVVLVYG